MYEPIGTDREGNEIQLFDMVNDPDETKDLSCDPNLQSVIIHLMQLYMQGAVKRDYAINSARGGRSATPDFSSLARANAEKEKNNSN